MILHLEESCLSTQNKTELKLSFQISLENEDWTLNTDKYFIKHFHYKFGRRKTLGGWGRVGFNSLAASKHFKFGNSCLAFCFSCSCSLYPVFLLSTSGKCKCFTNKALNRSRRVSTVKQPRQTGLHKQQILSMSLPQINAWLLNTHTHTKRNISKEYEQSLNGMNMSMFKVITSIYKDNFGQDTILF